MLGRGQLGRELAVVGNPEYRAVPRSNRYTITAEEFVQLQGLSVDSRINDQVDARLIDELAEKRKGVASISIVDHKAASTDGKKRLAAKLQERWNVPNVTDDFLAIVLYHPPDRPGGWILTSGVADP